MVLHHAFTESFLEDGWEWSEIIRAKEIILMELFHDISLA
jgi:hypothetical protein